MTNIRKKLSSFFRTFFHAVLFPQRWILLLVPLVSWTATAALFSFAAQYKDTVWAYVLYALSAYSLVIVCCAVPPVIRGMRAHIQESAVMRWLDGTSLGHAYLTHAAFRDRISLGAGMAVNLWYALSWAVAGVRSIPVQSVRGTSWAIALALYYLVLGAMRTYLLNEHRKVMRQGSGFRGKRGAQSASNAQDTSDAAQIRAYRNTAWLLGALNVPMGIMIILMIRTQSGFSYSGYMIYLSAMYTLYSAVVAVVNVLRFRKNTSLILSASKLLSFVSAAMSVLALQTAMIAAFSGGDEAYRVQMNMVTGGVVYGLVMLTMTLMMLRASRLTKAEKNADKKADKTSDGRLAHE